MLNDEEFAVAYRLYGEAFKRIRSPKVHSIREAMKPLVDYYEELTGYKDAHHNAIMHHHISLYGPPCEACGKPYRTPKASFCATCGNHRI